MQDRPTVPVPCKRQEPCELLNKIDKGPDLSSFIRHHTSNRHTEALSKGQGRRNLAWLVGESDMIGRDIHMTRAHPVDKQTNENLTYQRAGQYNACRCTIDAVNISTS